MTLLAPSLLDQSLGQIARTLPGATGIFHTHKLDFCCGGDISLRDAAARKGLDAEVLAQELSDLNSDANTAASLPDAASMIEHILQRYHAQHRQQLPELIRLAQRVERVHARHPDCPSGLAQQLINMLQELESHMLKEEQVLFPWLLRAGAPWPEGPIAMMRFEHDQHGEALAEVIRLTADIQPPDDACNTWTALYTGLEAFRRDLMQHIHLENNVLFKGLLHEPADLV